jgi:hypothetical protein
MFFQIILAEAAASAAVAVHINEAGGEIVSAAVNGFISLRC